MVDQILQMSLPYSENAKAAHNMSAAGSTYFPKENTIDIKDNSFFNKDISFSK
jgi:hypothetical protein